MEEDLTFEEFCGLFGPDLETAEQIDIDMAWPAYFEYLYCISHEDC